jgi:hypothetical protein
MFPIDVTLIPVKWGPFLSATGESARRVSVQVSPVLGDGVSLVWEATGSVLTAIEIPTLDYDAPVEFTVPAVDQAGWRDSTGAAASMWSYRAVARVEFRSGVVEYTKNFRALASMSLLDLALVPDGDVPPAPPTPDPGWQRPTNWPVMPDLVDGMFTAVFEVPNAIDPAPVELTFPDGPFSVDWLDGSPVESFGAGDTASHVYSGGIQGLVVSGAAGLPDAESLLSSVWEVRFKEDTLTTADDLLSSCYALQSVTLDLPALTTANNLLGGCYGLQSVTLDLPALTTADDLLTQCVALQSVTLDLPALTSAESLLTQCFSLQSVTLDLPALTTANNLLSSCYGLQSVTLDLPALTTANNLLTQCVALQSVTLDLPALTSAESLLSSCYALQSVTLDLPALTSADYLLTQCFSLQSVTLDLPALTSADYLLSSCYALQSVTLDLPALTSAESLLSSCYALQSVTLDLPALTSADYLLTQCFSLQSVTLDLPALTSAESLLSSCYALQSVTLDLPALTSADYLLSSCYGLQSVTLDLPALTSQLNFGNHQKLQRLIANGHMKNVWVGETKLSAQDLNALFTSLGTVDPGDGYTITITGARGAATADTSIATAKGWVVTN